VVSDDGDKEHLNPPPLKILQSHAIKVLQIKCKLILVEVFKRKDYGMGWVQRSNYRRFPILWTKQRKVA
jgi:hypothetical protein